MSSCSSEATTCQHSFPVKSAIAPGSNGPVTLVFCNALHVK